MNIKEGPTTRPKGSYCNPVNVKNQLEVYFEKQATNNLEGRLYNSDGFDQTGFNKNILYTVSIERSNQVFINRKCNKQLGKIPGISVMQMESIEIFIK